MPDQPPAPAARLAADELEGIVTAHVPQTRLEGTGCVRCYHRWPCDAYRAASDLQALRAAVGALIHAREVPQTTYGNCYYCQAPLRNDASAPHRPECEWAALRALLPPAAP